MSTQLGGYDESDTTKASERKEVTVSTLAGTKEGLDIANYGYDVDNTTWRPLKVNSNGELVIALANP